MSKASTTSCRASSTLLALSKSPAPPGTGSEGVARSTRHLWSPPLSIFAWILSGLHGPRRRTVAVDEVCHIKAGDRAVDHGPFSCHHHPVGPMCPAQHQCGQGIAMAGEAQLVEPEQREIGRLADGDLAEFRPTDAGCRALGGPAQRILVTDLRYPITSPLQQERGPHLLHQVRSVVRGRAINADADADTGLLHLADGAAAGGQELVAAGAMTDRRLRLAESLHLVCVEEDAMSEPRPRIKPG